MNISLCFKLEVGVFMLNRKGMTLIESLLAFEIYVTVVIVMVSLYINLYNSEIQLKNNYSNILEKETELSNQDELTETIEMVLH